MNDDVIKESQKILAETDKIINQINRGVEHREYVHPIHIVQQGETLADIAEKCLGSRDRVSDIMKENGMNSEEVYELQILKLPQ